MRSPCSSPSWLVKFFAFPVVVACVSVAVAVARPMSVVPIYYFWSALSGGHFGNRRDARLMILLMDVGFFLALLFAHDAQVPVLAYVSVTSVFLCVLVGYQRQRASSVALTRELAHAASRDSLTDLLNRRAFGEAFAREVQRARASHLPLSVVIFDLDHFNLNDVLGHAAGDDALVAFADVLRHECSSQTDVLGRMGGEEFAVVLFDSDAAGAAAHRRRGRQGARGVVARPADRRRVWAAHHERRHRVAAAGLRYARGPPCRGRPRSLRGEARGSQPRDERRRERRAHPRSGRLRRARPGGRGGGAVVRRCRAGRVPGVW